MVVLRQQLAQLRNSRGVLRRLRNRVRDGLEDLARRARVAVERAVQGGEDEVGGVGLRVGDNLVQLRADKLAEVVEVEIRFICEG